MIANAIVNRSVRYIGVKIFCVMINRRTAMTTGTTRKFDTFKTTYFSKTFILSHLWLIFLSNSNFCNCVRFRNVL